MDDARNLYDSIENYRDIEKLLGTQESIYIDFKQTQNGDGRIGDRDKAHFSKAASGFAHQEGGVIVWGIDARKDENEINCARELKPICNIKRLCSEFWDYTKYSTEPVVDRIDHKVIFENDNEQENKGFIVSFFPKSDREHIAKGNNKSDFYKRHGDSFVPLSVSDIKALFFRNKSPDLYLKIYFHGDRIKFILTNNGKGIAKNCAVTIIFPKSLSVSSSNEGIYDSVSKAFEPANLLSNSLHIKLNPGVFICPEEELVIRKSIAKISYNLYQIEYKIFSEDMIPKAGRIEIKKDGTDWITSTI